MPFFDTFFEQPPSGLGHALQVAKARGVLERLRACRPGLSRLLEIGPGWGELADLSRGAGIAYLGLEANILRAQELRRRGGQVLIGRNPPIPLAGVQYDAVVALNVLEHMPDFLTAIRFVQEMVRLTCPGGLVCINCPDFLAAGKLFWDADYTHNFPVTMHRLGQMFHDQGLRVMDAAYFSGPVSGLPAYGLSWLAQLFPMGLAGDLARPSPTRQRLARLRLTFMRNVFVIGMKP